jgi:hypothetical protein
MTVQEQVQTIVAVVQFAFNASFGEYMEVLPHSDEEGFKRMGTRFPLWWGELDPDNQRLVAMSAWTRWYVKTPAKVRDMTGLRIDEQMRML